MYGDQAHQKLESKKWLYTIVIIDQNTRLAYNLLVISLFENPDLVLAFPLTPKSHRGARSSITVVGQVNILVGLFDDDAAVRL